ncbi:MAG: hypothetical protein KatS3mg085_572 [Candidatus Dojkabacteria bacterium]|nr:MAG: hypothetical protein KatS3mg085_572 [Candidatus Dojkabacteria bacterium]
MSRQSSEFIIPFSFLVFLALVGLLVFVYFAQINEWFSPTKELIESIETDDIVASYPEAEFSQFTMSEVSEHNSNEDCYVVIDDLVYALSVDFLDDDKDDLFDELICGQDISEAFKTQVEYTFEDLTKFLIGEVVDVKDN